MTFNLYSMQKWFLFAIYMITLLYKIICDKKCKKIEKKKETEKIMDNIKVLSKGKHLWNNEKCFFIDFDSSFHSSDNQILTFQTFKCNDVIKCSSIKYEKYFTE